MLEGEWRRYALGAHRLTRNAARRESVVDLFDRIVWFGDLNYRVSTTRDVADAVLAQGMPEVLLAKDELLAQRENGRAFVGFMEHHVRFRPTFKVCARWSPPVGAQPHARAV